MSKEISIAIETSCRAGGVALGRGDELLRAEHFDASARHAVQLISRLDALLAGEGLTPRDVNHVYVSAGPGSFTGLRIGITVTRTLGQMLPDARLVAVPTPRAVAWNARELDWQHLAVILDAKDDQVYVARFDRPEGRIAPVGDDGTVSEADFLTQTPRPVLLTGEGLWHHELAGEGIARADEALYYPTAEGVWHVGRELAVAERFTSAEQLLPVYARKPEAVRLWEKRHGQG